MAVREEVIESLYQQHYEPLLKLAYLIVGSGSAEDLVQDAFVKAMDKWRPDAPPEAFRAWAKTTMTRMSISKWRKTSREQVAFQQHGLTPDISAPEVYPEVTAALAGLSPRQRTATVLRYYEDLSETEVANRMGVRVGTAKALLHQAREKLKVDSILVSSK